MTTHQETGNEPAHNANYHKAHVIASEDGTLNIENQRFIVKYKQSEQALDLDALAERYMPLFDLYDYVVGDWSYGQLRLKGFYADDTPNVPLDKTITHLPDYLLEFCSFGCDYFVLEHERSDTERKEQLSRVKDKSQQNFQERKQQKKQHKKQNNRQRRNRKQSSFNGSRHQHKKKKSRHFAIQEKKNKNEANHGKKHVKKAFEIH
ncbi:MAG: YutD family protein [Aerococcus sp.]|nr:YutD family protein [Aerococcus sp.]